MAETNRAWHLLGLPVAIVVSAELPTQENQLSEHGHLNFRKIEKRIQNLATTCSRQTTTCSYRIEQLSESDLTITLAERDNLSPYLPI